MSRKKFIKYQLPIPGLLWIPSWLLGIVIARYLPLNLFFLFTTLSISIVLFIFSKTRFFSIPVISLLAGFLIYTNHQQLPENHINNLFKSEYAISDKEYIFNDNTFIATRFQKDLNRHIYIQQFVRAMVITEKQPTTNGFRYNLKLIGFIDDNNQTIHDVKGKITFFTDYNKLKYGDIIETTLRISESYATNPGQIDFSVFQQLGGIYANALSISPIILVDYNPNLLVKFINETREFVQNKYLNTLSYSAPMALSLIIGQRQYLSEYSENFYSEILPLSGLIHFFAVSGFHVGIVALFVYFTFRLFRLSKNSANLLTIFILIIYAFLCSTAPPIVRAVIFFSVMIFSNIIGRFVNKWQVYLLSLFAVTFFNPALLFNISLQFSYLAFAGVLIGDVVFQKISTYFYLKTKYKQAILSYVCMIACIQILIMPVQIYYFQFYNLNAFIGNVLGAMILTVLIPLFILILIIPSFVPLYNVLVLIAEFLTDIFNHYVVFLSKLPFVFSLSSNMISLIALFVFTSVALFLMAYSKHKSRFIVSAALCCLSILVLIPKYSDNSFKMIFFDSGNADCVLIRFSRNDYMLIDVGDSDKNSKNISRNLLLYLKKENVKNISKVILTHQHLDHYGGIFMLGQQVQVDTLIVSEVFYNSDLINSIKYSEFFANTDILVISDTLTYKHSDYMIHFLHPSKGFIHRNENNNSIISKLIYKDFSTLFMGDLEIDAERIITQNYPEMLKADILKAAHHGSNTSTHNELLSLVQPELVVFTATGDETRNFPDRRTLERVDKYFTTGRGGAVIINQITKE